MRILVVAILALTSLAGCLDSEAGNGDVDETVTGATTSVFERAELAFNLTDQWSHTLTDGVFEILDGVSVFVDVDLSATEGGAALDPLNPPMAHLGLFLPDIPGCDFDQVQDVEPGGAGGLFIRGMSVAGRPSDLADGDPCKVPVIADVGPYYRTPEMGAVRPPLGSEMDVPADEQGGIRLGGFLIETFVPQGYAVAQVSVLGSGQSTHCFNVFGMSEQLGVKAAVDWLGSQEWSNGNVGLIGRSYDGSTPWQAAAMGSEYLRTIVPISGLHGLQELVTWNGASESRIYSFQNLVYGGYGFDGHPTDVHQACPDWFTAAPLGLAAAITGDHIVEEDGTYWKDRDFLDRALTNFDGSLYMIHGLQDYNVDPHAGWIPQKALADAGFEVKGMWGQWQHMYPDRFAEHRNCDACPSFDSVRMDWAQDLLEWFGFYLMDYGQQPALHNEVQLLDGRWRVDDALVPSNGYLREVPIDVAPVGLSSGGPGYEFDLGVLDADNEVIMTGLSHLEVYVEPTSTEAQIYIELFDATTGEDFGLSYGITTLRHAPANENDPGEPGVYKVPLQYFAAALEAGHSLGLRIDDTGNGYMASRTMTPTTVTPRTLQLAVVEVADDQWFTPPVWYELDAEGNPIDPYEDEE